MTLKVYYLYQKNLWFMWFFIQMSLVVFNAYPPSNFVHFKSLILSTINKLLRQKDSSVFAFIYNNMCAVFQSFIIPKMMLIQCWNIIIINSLKSINFISKQLNFRLNCLNHNNWLHVDVKICEPKFECSMLHNI